MSATLDPAFYANVKIFFFTIFFVVIFFKEL